LRRFTRSPGRRLVRPNRTSPEDRHHDEPPIGELVVTNDRVSVVGGLTRAAEALENRVGRNRTVQDSAGYAKTLALLCVDCYPGVDRLHDVVGPDCEAVVGWVSQCGSALGAFESDAETVKAFDENCRWSETL
jgi:hypothetical protein